MKLFRRSLSPSIDLFHDQRKDDLKICRFPFVNMCVCVWGGGGGGGGVRPLYSQRSRKQPIWLVHLYLHLYITVYRRSLVWPTWYRDLNRDDHSRQYARSALFSLTTNSFAFSITINFIVDCSISTRQKRDRDIRVKFQYRKQNASHASEKKVERVGDNCREELTSTGVLFNDALNTFYLRLIRHMVKDHSDSEKGNPLPPHGVLFPINSKGSFICIIPQTGLHIPRPLLHQSWSTGWNENYLYEGLIIVIEMLLE